MVATISFNPYSTSAPQDSFLLQTQGKIQGLADDDPASNMWLSGGVLASTETLPMWGGVPVSLGVNNTGSGSQGLGALVLRSTSQANTAGFAVFNRANSMVITPGNSVPLAASGNYVSYYRIGSGQVRVAMRCDPALVAALTSPELITTPALYWDVTNYQVTLTTTGGNFALPASVQLLSVNTNSKIVSYNSGTGLVTWTTGDSATLAF